MLINTIQQLERVPLPIDHDPIWYGAFRQASGQPHDDNRTNSLVERIHNLRDSIYGELVAFHESVDVSEYSESEHQPVEGCRLWWVDIPFTLFPLRDQGFNRLKCTVQFDTELQRSGKLEIVELLPREFTSNRGIPELFGMLQLRLSDPERSSAAYPCNVSVTDIGFEIYGLDGMRPVGYQGNRTCFNTRILNGATAQWEFDDPFDPGDIGIETHEITALVRVADDIAHFFCEAHLSASCDESWASRTHGVSPSGFNGDVKSFLQSGIPVQANGEWDVIVPH